MNLKKIHILLFIFAFSNALNAQNFNIGAELGGGFIIAHRENVKHLAQSHPFKLELSLQEQTKGNKEWQHIYNLPKIDHSLLYIDYNNPILGQTIAYTIQLAYPFYKKNNFSLATDIGFGIGINTKIFDRENNYKNNMLGSRVIGSLHVKLYTELKLSKKTTLDLGFGMIHFSNGAFTLPNLGINVPYSFLGVNYSINTTETERKIIDLKNVDSKKWNYSFAFSNGFKDVYPTGGRKHLFNVLGIKTHYKINKIYNLVAGIDGFYDRSVSERRIEDGFNNEGNYNTKIGILIGNELKVGDFTASIHFGRYLYQAYFSTYSNFYQRYQAKYYITNNYYVAVGMKVHKGVADVIEWTIGIEL